MESFRFILLLLGAMAGLCGCQQQTDNRPHVIVCGDDQVLIIQPGLSDQEENRVVWQWKVEEARMQIPEKYVRLMIPLDECKPVDNASKLLLTSSGGGALLLDKTTKECLFYADVPMAHSAELSPEGKIAIALSTHPHGNSLEVYDINRPDQMLSGIACTQATVSYGCRRKNACTPWDSTNFELMKSMLCPATRYRCRWTKHGRSLRTTGTS